MVQPSGSRKPAIRLRVVVLPQPEGPSTEVSSPSRNSTDTSSTATASPKRLHSLSSRTLGIASALRRSGARGVVQHLHAQLERAPAVLARNPLGCVAVPLLDRRQQRLRIGDDLLGAPGMRQGGAAELADLLLQMLEQPIERLVAGGAE